MLHYLSNSQASLFLAARRYASAGICDKNVSVRPSVCQLAGIVSKRRKLARHDFFTIW